MALNLIRHAGADLDLAIKFFAGSKVLAVDTETTGLDPHQSKVLLVQISNEIGNVVFDVARIGEKALAAKLRPIFEDEGIVKVLQNAKFDYKMMMANFEVGLENIHDTFITEQILCCGEKKFGFGLKDIIEKYLRFSMDKSEQKSFANMKFGDEFTEDQLFYASEDTKHLLKIRIAQLELIHKYKLEQVYRVEMDAITAIADMELNGVYLDKGTWLMAEEDAKLHRVSALSDLNKQFMPYCNADFFGMPQINYNSPKQLLPLLKKIIGKDAKHLTGTGEGEIKDIDHVVIAALLNYREAEKRISTYGREFFDHINPVTGKIHTTFNQCQTDTGRLSSNNPNLQNIVATRPDPDRPGETLPSYYRLAFCTPTPDTESFIDCDYSGMELRVLGDLSKEPLWLEIFEKNLDPHATIGSKIYGKPIRKKGTNGPNDPGENWGLRRGVKTLIFGLNYGMGAAKLALAMKISIEEAKALIANYWKALPEVKKYLDVFYNQSVANECFRSPYDGRVRWLTGYDLDSQKDLGKIRTMGNNYPMQSGNATVTKTAMARLRKEFKGTGVKPLLNIHDELLLSSPNQDAEWASEKLQHHMKAAAYEYIKNVPIVAEAKISKNWDH